MITIIELFTHPIFKNFQLISGENGLYNPVTGTAIFEWETPKDVEETFLKGEFVITTLSQAKNDVAYAENCLKSLLEKGVSAIAIKTVYFKDVSDEIKYQATKYKIPVFLFSDTYFDDIIFTIKNALFSKDSEIDFENRIKTLINSCNENELIIKGAKEINSFFYNNLICCFITARGGHSINYNIKSRDSSNVVYSIIKYANGILIVYTVKDSFNNINEQLNQLLIELGFDRNNSYVGLSSLHSGLENLGYALIESIYANTSCILDKKSIMEFQNSGLDRLLLPVYDNLLVDNYYKNQLGKLMDYDSKHNSNLFNTLVVYVGCNGNIQLTAKKSFQHSNTIRYRINKIKTLLNIEDSIDSYPQLYILIRLYLIHKYLDTIL